MFRFSLIDRAMQPCSAFVADTMCKRRLLGFIELLCCTDLYPSSVYKDLLTPTANMKLYRRAWHGLIEQHFGSAFLDPDRPGCKFDKTVRRQFDSHLEKPAALRAIAPELEDQ